MGADGYLLYQIGDDGKGFGTLSNASGTDLHTVMLEANGLVN